MVKFELNAIRKLAKGLLYKEGCKKGVHIIREKGEKSNWSQGLCP